MCIRDSSGRRLTICCGLRDANGVLLDEASVYTLNIPADVPARNFISVGAYDSLTRSEFQTGQAFPSKDNKRNQLTSNDDDPVTLHCGPEDAEGQEKH